MYGVHSIPLYVRCTVHTSVCTVYIPYLCMYGVHSIPLNKVLAFVLSYCVQNPVIFDRDLSRVHYSNVIMSGMASYITSASIVCWTVRSGTDQRKHKNYASLAFVRGIHLWPVDSPRKGQVTQKNVSIWWRHDAKVVSCASIHLLQIVGAICCKIVLVYQPLVNCAPEPCTKWNHFNTFGAILIEKLNTIGDS